MKLTVAILSILCLLVVAHAAEIDTVDRQRNPCGPRRCFVGRSRRVARRNCRGLNDTCELVPCNRRRRRGLQCLSVSTPTPTPSPTMTMTVTPTPTPSPTSTLTPCPDICRQAGSLLQSERIARRDCRGLRPRCIVVRCPRRGFACTER